MRAAYSGIQYCCEALAEGKVQVQRIKKGVEDAKVIVGEAKSIWQTIASFFPPAAKTTPATPLPASAPQPVTQKKKKDEYTTHIPTEDEIVQQFIDYVGAFYKSHRVISENVEQGLAEEYTKDRPDPHVILQLSAFKHELDGAYMKLSGMMRGANVPPQLGPLWDNFNLIYDKVSAEQDARKARERLAKARARAREFNARNERIDTNWTRFWAVVLVWYAWLFIGGVWLNNTTTTR